MTGGCGGNSAAPGGNTSGLGGLVVCTYSVVPGQVLNVYVGAAAGAAPAAGVGACAGGTGGTGTGTYFPGGGGGGSSAIRIGGTAIANTVLEAAGGGGGAGNGAGFRVHGGDAYWPTGIAGGNGTAPAIGGGGGTQAAGGTGGAGTGTGAGTVGTQTVGGNGGNEAGTDDGGGGGGGGWWAGGGGGGGLNAGAGGAGSNYVGGSGVIAVTTNDSNATCGNGSVIICAYPFAGAISGKDTVCVGSTMTLSDATATGTSGTWSSSSANATVGSSTGIVTGVAAGTATITFSSTNACGTTTTTTVIDIFPNPTAINGTLAICVGGSTTLTDLTPTGTWSSTTTTVASIGSASGTATGITAGTSTISYTVKIGTVGCAATAVLTVNPIPTAILGTLTACVGLTSQLTDASGGGTWSSSNGNTNIVAGTGIATGVIAGTSTITYTSGPGCTTTAIFTVNPNPTTITGTPSVCVGLTTTLNSTPAGGNWGISNANATIGATTGVVTGVVAGTSVVTYTLSTGCITTTIVTVNALPTAINGTLTVCTGGTTPLTDGVAGGTWSSSNANATIGATGIVTGVAAGTSIITYTSGAGCIATAIVTVNTMSPINPTPATICLGGTLTLTDATGGGAWSSTTPSVATISGTGLVTSVAIGTTTISYTLAGCFATEVVTVNNAPGAITPATATVCTGSTTNLTDATSGGVWSSSNGNSTVSVTGVVTGVTAGTSTISYSIGTCSSTAVVTVNTTPAIINPAPVTICSGGTATLTDATGGGAWSSSTTTVATITGGGLVTAVGIGTTTISYTLAGCSATTVATVNNAPGAITPATATVCTGSTTNLTDATSGGVWSSSNGNSTVSVTGVVTGVTAGTSTISYSIGTCYSTATVSVNTTPAIINPAPITICSGGTATLTDATGGGAWSSSTTTVATITGGGLVTAVGIGTTTISYTLAGCSATTIATVNNGPAAITPATATVCTGSTTNLTDATSGGVWSSSNGNTTVSVTGVVTGVTAGTSTISYSIGTCYATATVSVNTTPAIINPAPVTICSGGTATLTDATGGGVWSSSTTAVATITGGGLVTAVGIGTTTISYTLAGCSATTVATVNNGPVAITPATATVCAGSTTNLTDATSGGVWSSSNGNATVGATGIVTGVAVGLSTISYSIGTCYSTAAITINAGVTPISPAAATLCIGNTTTLTDATGGGVWSSSSANATVAGGVVTAVSAGTATISYAIGGCFSTALITVGSTPAAITPATANVCIGSTANLTDAVSGGIWSSSSASATVGATGIVTGVSIGTATISYSIGSCVATATVTVNPGTNPGTISGPTDILCPGNFINLTDAIAGGVWSASNGNATVNASGVTTGVTVGTVVISYGVTSICGTSYATYIVTVDAAASSGAILGPLTICVGSFDIYLNYTSGGVWSVTNGNAVISPSGVVTAITAGPETVVYSEPGACTTSSLNITIIPATTGAGAISGPANVCIGSSITLSDPTAPGGTWSGTNTHATVGLGTGLVSGVTAGLDTVIYTLTTACGTYTTSATVNVDATATPAPIVGPSSDCVGSTILLTDADAGGTWSSSNANATVTPGVGLVTGITAGLDTIKYTVINGCGLGSTTKVITIAPAPSAGTINGPSGVCIAGTITLSDAVSGGTWSASNGNATISASGVVTGVTAGTDNIIYTITASCGTVSSTKTITVNPFPSANTVLGPDSVCVGSTITLLDFTSGGVWSAGNGNAAITAIGIPSITVTGVAVGTDPISYTVTNSCGSTSSFKIVTVVSIPNPGVITGISNVCVGSAITLSDTVSGGIWLSSNGTAAILGPGIVSGVTTGIDSIFYVLTNMCGTNEARHIVNVNPLPVVPAISGPVSQCVGTVAGFTDGLAGGIWTGSDATIASVNTSTGSVTGLAQGIVTISYTVTNAFGCPGSATTVDTIDAIPVVSAVMGADSVCLTSTITLSDTTAGGVWSSSNTTIGSVDAIGNLTGTGAGVVTISYSVTGMCGTTAATLNVTVNPLPVISAILGTTDECVGTSVTLSNTTTGGIWISTDTTIATINSAGLVTGIATGTVTIIYQVTNIHGCVSAVSITDTVNTLPVVTPVTGITSECIGSIAALTDATAGGVWSSSDNTIATVDGLGNVTGIAGGIATISYTVTNGSGCTASATTPDTVNIMPVSTSINGMMALCVGSATTLSDTVSGGVWGSVNNTVATIDPVTGLVTAVANGLDTITYTVTNSCGSVVDSALFLVNPVPTVSPITATFSSACVGSAIALTDATTGGAWSSSDITVATVDASGNVTGIATGTATITYTFTNISGCSGFATYTVTIAPAIAGIDVVPASATLCTSGSTINMHVSTAVTGLTYQWLYNGNIIPGATNSGYIADSAGTYSLDVTNGVCTETIPGTVVSNAPNPVISFTAPDVLYTGSFNSYQWYKNGVVIPGANSSTYVETGAGNYTVVVTDINGCSVTSAVYTVGGTTGINNVTISNGIKIYPNPATSVLNIESAVKVNITMLGIDGKMILHQDDAHTIDISALPNGMYMIMVYDENNLLLSTSKFVKSEQ